MSATVHPHLPAPADGVVARVAGHPITEAQLDARLTAIYRGPMRTRLPHPGSPAGRRIRRWAVQLLTTEALVLAEATRHNIPAENVDLRRVGVGKRLLTPTRRKSTNVGVAANGADPETEAAVAAAASGLFAAVTAEVEVSEAEIRRYYDANPDLWRHPERRTIRQAIGDTPLAARRAAPGPPYDLTRGELAGAVEDSVFAAREGDLVGPVHSPLGWHLVRILAVRPARDVPYDQVRPAIRRDLLAAARGAAFDDWLAARRVREVWIAPGYEHPGDPSTPDFIHRH